jgi:hypothetical protein
MIGLLNQFNVCIKLSEQIHGLCVEERTSILNAVLRKYTMTPVGDTPHSLHAATSMWGRSIRWINFVAFSKVEALFETTTHSMPFLTMGVTCGTLVSIMATDNHLHTDDSFVRRNIYVVRESKPFESTAEWSSWTFNLKLLNLLVITIL